MLSTVVRVVLIAAAMLAATLPTPPASSDAPAVETALRLRKLHLVRPDLIPYPIAYEVVC